MATKTELLQQVNDLKMQLNAQKRGLQFMDIVYPNVEKLVQWEELKYSLRSLEKNLIDLEFRVWIVGDRPEWLSDEARFIDVPCSGKTPRLDVALKRMAVDNHSEISDSYLWMNDDIYLINPVTYADLCIPKALHDLAGNIKRYDPQTTWGMDMMETFRRLKAEKLPTIHYAVHVPYILEKIKSKEIFRVFDLKNKSYVFENLYYNYFFPHLLPYWLNLEETNNLLFCVNRQNPNWNMLARQLKVKKMMNNSESGMNDKIKMLLKSLFPEKSRFEK